MAEIPEWFPRTIEELYRLDPGEEPSLSDPRVASSHGGGMFPVQHWGVLADGRVFYFRYRHGWASITLGPAWFEPGLLPAADPRVTYREWEAAIEAGKTDEELPKLWLHTGAGFLVTEQNDGWFDSAEELNRTFAKCLDDVWDQPFDEAGWEALRQTDWHKKGRGAENLSDL